MAYGFPFSKETIGGITPIADMIDATKTGGPRAASARFPTPFGASGPKAPLDRASMVAALTRPMPTIPLASGTMRGDMASSLSGQSLTPISLPLVFSGFDPATFEWARGIFAGMGFTPMMGTGGKGVIPAGGIPDLQPGGAVGISLIEGDMDLSATGTVTHIDNGRVYAFGHPFYNLGPTQFPMRKAYVYSVFPSLYQSWKISSAADVVGTIEQDRITAVAGMIGKSPKMIPVEVKIKTSRGQERTFAFRMVEDELFSPVLAYVALASVLQNNERAFGTSTIRVNATLSLTGGREVRVEDLFTAGAAGHPGRRPRGRASRVPHDERLRAGEDREGLHRRRLRRDGAERDPRPRLAGAHRARARGLDRPPEGSAPHLSRGDAGGDDPDQHPRHRALRHLHPARGRRSRR